MTIIKKQTKKQTNKHTKTPTNKQTNKQEHSYTQNRYNIKIPLLLRVITKHTGFRKKKKEKKLLSITNFLPYNFMFILPWEIFLKEMLLNAVRFAAKKRKAYY